MVFALLLLACLKRQRSGSQGRGRDFPRGGAISHLPVARRIHFRPHAEATCPISCSLSGSALAPMGPRQRRPRAKLSPIANANLNEPNRDSD